MFGRVGESIERCVGMFESAVIWKPEDVRTEEGSEFTRSAAILRSGLTACQPLYVSGQTRLTCTPRHCIVDLRG